MILILLLFWVPIYYYKEMAQLNNEQLELMSSINKIRLEIIKEFR